MRLAVIACRVFTRELSRVVSQSEATVELHWLPQGLHDTPTLLRERILQTIAEIERENAAAPARRKLDAIALCYGLCGGGLAGIRAGCLPLILPRVDDCIGLLLGSEKRYRDYFAHRGGIYWYTPGWTEFADTPSRVYYEAKRRDYAARFGEDNAQWLLEQENAWIPAYENCIYLAPPDFSCDTAERAARAAAAEYGWTFERVPGAAHLLEGLLAGNWDESEFLVCPPDEEIAPSFDERLVRIKP